MFFTNNASYKKEVVTEAYFGKTDILLEIESLLNQYVANIKKDTLIKGGTIRISSDVTNKTNRAIISKVEKLVEKQFKIKEFILNMYTGAPMDIVFRPAGNAFTRPKSFNFTKEASKLSDKFIDGSNTVIGVNVDTAIISWYDLTGEELTGIILHEIGHGLSVSIMQYLNICMLAPNIGGAIVYYVASEFGYIASIVGKFIEEILDAVPPLRFIDQTISGLAVNISAILPAGINLISIPSMLRSLNPIRWSLGYVEEKYADSFSASYGYGPALSSGLAKFESLNVGGAKLVRAIPVVNQVADLGNVIAGSIFNLIDEHPANPVRIKAITRKLRRDLKDPKIDPRAKELAKRDLDMLDNFLDNYYLEISQNNNKKKIFTYFYNKLIIKVFKGKVDIRDLIPEDKFQV